MTKIKKKSILSVFLWHQYLVHDIYFYIIKHTVKNTWQTSCTNICIRHCIIYTYLYFEISEYNNNLGSNAWLKIIYDVTQCSQLLKFTGLIALGPFHTSSISSPSMDIPMGTPGSSKLVVRSVWDR